MTKEEVITRLEELAKSFKTGEWHTAQIVAVQEALPWIYFYDPNKNEEANSNEKSRSNQMD